MSRGSFARDVDALVAEVVRHFGRRPLARLSLKKSMPQISLTVLVACSGTRSAGGRRRFLRLRTARFTAARRREIRSWLTPGNCERSRSWMRRWPKRRRAWAISTIRPASSRVAASAGGGWR
jgi:hypothetical protein